MKISSCPANVNGQRAIAAYQFPDEMLCIAMTKDLQIWKMDFWGNGWDKYEPDLLELALHGKTIEIEIIRKLWDIRNNIPRSSNGRTTGFEPVNRGSNP